jgi:hypothetical protein
VAYWTWRIASDEHGTARAVVVGIGLAVLVGVLVALVLIHRGRGGAVLVLTDTELRLERRRRPVVLERRHVVAVRGNVPGRPSWSERVLVETRDDLVTLPPLDRSPALLVPELQEWARVPEFRSD